MRPATDWPRNRDELLMLDELPYDRYIKMREARGSYPPGTLTHATDEHGALWRAVALEALGIVRVRMT